MFVQQFLQLPVKQLEKFGKFAKFGKFGKFGKLRNCAVSAWLSRGTKFPLCETVSDDLLYLASYNGTKLPGSRISMAGSGPNSAEPASAANISANASGRG